MRWERLAARLLTFNSLAQLVLILITLLEALAKCGAEDYARTVARPARLGAAGASGGVAQFRFGRAVSGRLRSVRPRLGALAVQRIVVLRTAAQNL